MICECRGYAVKLRRIYGVAIKIAEKAHRGQKRWKGEPYITHPKYVASKFPDCINCQIVAILHDVIEDTDVTDLILIDAGIPDHLVNSVFAISKQDGEGYKDYILRVREDKIATSVKIQDLKHNLMSVKKGSMRDKWLLSLYILGVRE